MHFPTAGIDIAIWIPPLVAFVISFFTSMGGISGAFLLLPFQVSVLGYANPSVSATNHVYNVLAIPSGVYRYWREGRMMWPLALIVIAGTLPAVFIGAVIRVTYLPDPRHFKLFAAAVLLYIGLRMVLDLRNKNNNGPDSGKVSSISKPQREQRGAMVTGRGNMAAVTVHACNLRRLSFSFHGETFVVPFWGIFLLSFAVGIIGGIYGIGGGSIIAPFLVTYFGMPVHVVAGAALMGTFVTSVAGVLFYQGIAPLYFHIAVAPDWLLGLLFGLGGMAGMYCGAYCQKLVPARVIKVMLAGVMVATALKYVLEFLRI